VFVEKKYSMNVIRLTQEELRSIVILERFTGALAVDCVWNEDERRIIFIVRQKDTGKVIGRGGTTIRKLREHFRKQVEIIEYSEKVEVFASNTLAPVKPKSVEIFEESGIKSVVMKIIPSEKGIAIGKNGRNISRSRMLMERHFGIKKVLLQTIN
jgi:N utilization substance protein A